MIVNSLQVKGFRNLSIADISFAAGLNLIIGENGSGKTSLLEALYYLGHGKSFRTHKQAALINNSVDSWLLCSKLSQPGINTGDYSSLTLGFTQQRDGARKANIDEKPIKSISQLSEMLPMLYIGADSHFIWQTNTRARRNQLDWGVFHVEHSFISSWRNYNRLLAHYNNALKARAADNYIKQWLEQLSEAGEKVNQFRQSYVDLLQPKFTALATELGQLNAMSLDYYCGWPAETNLRAALLDNLAKDRMLGYAQYGAQRADLNYLHNGCAVKDQLSQGQSKLATYALRLAQASVLNANSTRKVIYLLDDMPSELDSAKQQQILKLCQQMSNQVFMTAIELPDLTFSGQEQVYNLAEGQVRDTPILAG